LKCEKVNFTKVDDIEISHEVMEKLHGCICRAE